MTDQTSGPVEARAFPPLVISAWLRHEMVNADDLVDEFRYWGIKMAGGDPDNPLTPFPFGRLS